MGRCQDVFLQPTSSHRQCIRVIKHHFNVTVILHWGRLGGKNGKHNKGNKARWGMRWHSLLSSLQNAASAITHGALDIQRATALRNMPDLTEKNAINTFLLFSPSLSPDLFMFLELCLHCLALITGDVGCCSALINGTSSCFRVRNRWCECGRWHTFIESPAVKIFPLKCSFEWAVFKNTLKAKQCGLQIPERTRARGGSRFGMLETLHCAGAAQVQSCAQQIDRSVLI